MLKKTRINCVLNTEWRGYLATFTSDKLVKLMENYLTAGKCDSDWGVLNTAGGLGWVWTVSAMRDRHLQGKKGLSSR